MAIVINGSGTVTGLAVGGLPDGTVDAGTLATDSVTAAKIATNSVDSAELIDGAVDDSHIAALAASKLTGALPAISGLSVTNINSPAFYVKANGTQEVSPDAWTAINYANETLDSNNYFASNRFTPQVAGWYFFVFNVYVYESALRDTRITFDTNTGADWISSTGTQKASYWQGNVAGIMYMNGSSHYCGAQVYSPTSGNYTLQPSHFAGFKLGAI